MPPFSAVVLAAGRSTRMGRDKALLEVGGTPLWRRQRDVLVQAGAAEIFLSVRPEQAWAREALREGAFAAPLHDAFPGGGPLVGITAALERAAHPHVAVLAIDLPGMEAAWFRRLRADSAPGVGAVGRRAGEAAFFEPLAAVYPAAMKWLAWEAVSRREYALQPLLGEAVRRGLMRTVEITPVEASWFENWNEPKL